MPISCAGPDPSAVPPLGIAARVVWRTSATRASATPPLGAGAATIESPSATPSPGETLRCGTAVVVAHGWALRSAAPPSKSSRASNETIASPGNPPLTADEREAICSR
jgi:hypothetical protein